MPYNPKSGNPFTECDPHKEWTTNNLILQDPKMREKAGVTVLDREVAEMFPCEGAPQSKILQTGGWAAFGVPFHLKGYGSDKVVPYDQQGGMPYHYFKNNKKW